MLLPEGRSPLVEGGIPGCVVQEVVQLLAITPRHQRCQDRHRLVVLSRQEQTDQVTAEGLTRRTSSEEMIELGTEGINGVSRGDGGFAGRCYG
jgi:hypothetical protein